MKRKKVVSGSDKRTGKKGEIGQYTLIGVGASAGGLDALKKFFDQVPSDCSHSFVVIQHLSPDYKSMMPELLAKNTDLSIKEISPGMKIDPGTVYLIPAGNNIIVEGNKFVVTRQNRKSLNMPIDIFFNSLATDKGEQAIGIVLSGTGSDGTNGLRSIKEAGGMAMVQKPETAQFDGMPKSAIATGLIDFILPVEQMPGELMHFISHPRTGKSSLEIDIEKDEETLLKILNHIRNLTELDFTWYKRPTLVRRIASRMSITRNPTLHDYLKLLYENPHEVQVLTRQFLIGVTRFFRDTAAWEIIENKVIPELINGKPMGQLIKVWSVGCSTGEEVYSLAIAIKEQLEKLHKPIEVKIFATDIEQEHINIASKGIYPESIVADVSRERLEKYFIKIGGEYKVTEEIRKMVIFSRHNAVEDPPFNKMDLVVCRNMLIYLQSAIQEKIIAILHYALNLNGVLFLGPSETIGKLKEYFGEIDRKWRIYYNKEIARTIGFEPMRYPDVYRPYGGGHQPGWVNPRKMATENRLSEVLNSSLQEQFGVASVYIDENFDIIHAVGGFKKYLELPEERFSLNLLKMVPENLSIALNTAVRKAGIEKEKILYKGLKLRREDAIFKLNVLIRPFELEPGSGRFHFLVMFMEEEAKETTTITVTEQERSTKDIGRVAELEDEIKETKENLQSAIEEVETSNEELQSTNEELMAANEELQSTNEELQSVNEELHTVNAEHQQKIEELAALNADMNNLLKSTEIGTIFLDRDLRIRKFTPSISEHFNIIPADIGRPITHFSSSLGDDIKGRLLSDIQEVLSTSSAKQQEIMAENGKFYLERMLPFINAEMQTQGVVITYIDVSEIKEAEEDLRKSEERYHKLVAEMKDYAIFVLNRSGTIETWNKGAESIYGYKEKEIIGKPFKGLCTKKMRDAGKSEKLVEEALKNGKSEYEGWWRMKSGKEFWGYGMLTPMLDEKKKIVGYSCVIRDQTLQKAAEEKLRVEAEKLLYQSILLKSIPDGIVSTDLDLNIKTWSSGAEKLYQWSEKEVLGKKLFQVLPVDKDDNKTTDILSSVWKDGSWRGEAVQTQKSGSKINVLSTVSVFKDIEGKPAGIVAVNRDITDLKITENLLKKQSSDLEEFAFVATHDLRSPIANLRGLIDVFKKKKFVTGSNKPLINKISDSVDRIQETLHDLISVITDKNGGEKEIIKVSFKKTAQDVINDLEEQVKLERATITQNFSKAPSIHYIQGHIKSILQNMLTNALKYRSSKRNPVINITTEKAGEYIKLSIADNGIGIDSSQRDKIFGLFKRLETKVDGKGIGLFITKSQVEALGGKIDFDSIPGKGTTFNIYLKDQIRETESK